VIVADTDQFEQSRRLPSLAQAGCAIPGMPRIVETRRPAAPP